MKGADGGEQIVAIVPIDGIGEIGSGQRRLVVEAARLVDGQRPRHGEAGNGILDRSGDDAEQPIGLAETGAALELADHRFALPSARAESQPPQRNIAQHLHRRRLAAEEVGHRRQVRIPGEVVPLGLAGLRCIGQGDGVERLRRRRVPALQRPVEAIELPVAARRRQRLDFGMDRRRLAGMLLGPGAGAGMRRNPAAELLHLGKEGMPRPDEGEEGMDHERERRRGALRDAACRRPSQPPSSPRRPSRRRERGRARRWRRSARSAPGRGPLRR